MDIQSGNIEISPNALDDHKKDEDMYPTSQGVVPLKVCHARGSTTNPYEVIYIGARGLEEHKKHGDEVMQFFSGWEEAKPTRVL